MKLLRTKLRWTRLGIAFLVSLVLDWVFYRWAVLSPSPPHANRFLDLLVAPGVVLALLLTGGGGAHGGKGFIVIVAVVTTLILTAIFYGLLSLIVWMLAGGLRGKKSG